MAINKRKDSAALFELIDKSTLKVPKQSGSLKIPSWWSSKSNPPVAPRHNGAGVPLPVTIHSAPAPRAEDPLPSADIPQSRLFEAAGANVQGTSPSIRPPAPSADRAPASPAPSTNGNGHHANGAHFPAHQAANNGAAVLDASDIAHQVAEDEAAATVNGSHEGYAGSGAGSRPFAPQTMSQTDGFGGDWGSAQKFRLARTPMWVLVAGGSAVVIVLALLIYLLMGIHWRATKPANDPALTPLVGPVSSHPSLLPPAGQRQTSPPPASNNTNAANTSSLLVPKEERHPDPATPGQVFGPGAVARTPTLFYIVIATSTSEEIARRNAALIAAHGVDVSIETQAGRSKDHYLYKLISVKGFSTISEAQPLKKQIVDIGHLLPEFARTRRAWDDATVARWSSLAPAKG